MKKKWRLGNTQGQSLVELTITLPILLLMFVGLVEIGYVLRNYLVVVNATREGTRFAARGQWFDNADEPEGAADPIIERVLAAGGYVGDPQDGVRVLRTESAGAEHPANAKVIIYFVSIPDQIDGTGGLAYEAPATVSWIAGPLSYDSKIDIVAEAEAARQANYEFNDEYYVQGELDMPSENNFVIIETYYAHRQLLGMPIFTEILPDIIPLYSKADMRITLDYSEMMGGN
jgi:Flp pilus assembly protein TadG